MKFSRLFENSLFHTLINLRGNARGAVFTEPLWGIPFNLFAPYVSIYMLSLGLSDVQIGTIISIGLVLQIVTALLSGVITDKFGRRWTTFFGDAISWTIPCIIWAVAKDFNYFVVAAFFNSLWRIPMTSWSCLVVEATEPEQLMDVYSWIYISGLLAAFFAPLAGVLITHFTLVPTMRGLYAFAAVMITVKFVTMNALVTETPHGRLRMQEAKHQSLPEMLGEYRGVLPRLLGNPRTLYTLGLMLVLGITQMISGTFWSIYVTGTLQIPAGNIALYPFARSIVMLLFYFLVIPLIRAMNFKRPLVIGFGGFILSQLVLISIPAQSYWLLLVSVLLEATSFAAVSVQIDRLTALTVDAQERARIVALLYVIVICFTSPFGWIAGALSEINRALPFMLNIGLYAAGGVLVFLAARQPREVARVAEAVIQE